MIAKLYPAIKAFAAIALSGVVLSGCAFYPKEAAQPLSQPEPISAPALSELSSSEADTESSSRSEEEPDPLPTPPESSSMPTEPAESLSQAPQTASSVPMPPESSLPEPPTEVNSSQSSGIAPSFADPPMVISALLKKGVPNGFATAPGAAVSETTVHIEATFKNTQYQRYNYILSLEDIPTPLILGTYKTTVIPSQGTQVSLSVPLELSREEYDLIDSIDASKISLSIVGIDKDEQTMPSAPMYLDADKTSFITRD